MSAADEYLLGMEPAEVERLGRQHEAWQEATTRILEAAGIGPGQTVVDLGCGPGFTTLELARRVGDGGRVLAVDSSERALAHLRVELERRGIGHVETLHGEATAAAIGSFAPDAVFSRWLFCYLEDPATLVARLGAELAPGARLAVMDYWNYRAIRAEPLTPLFRTVFGAVEDSFAAAGGSLDVAGRLPALFEGSGFAVDRLELVTGVTRPGEPLWLWVSEFLELYLPALVRHGALSEAELGAHREEWEWRSGLSGSLLFLPPVLGVIGTRRARD